MKDEIERKFLVHAGFPGRSVENYERIAQGYICTDPERTVRVRIQEGRGELTIKGPSSLDGLVRKEFEKEISLRDADMLMSLCPTYVEKCRGSVVFAGKAWSVDVFTGLNSGLILAEIELASVHEEVEIPWWAYKEVTGDIRYYNSYLSLNPYSTWPDLQA